MDREEQKSNRLLVFEPNPNDNRLYSTEDLSIYVELNSVRKNRSVINNGVITNNSEGASKPIKFIGGSKTGVDDNGKDVYNLTTNYTNATTSFDKNDQNRDLETLGIENIHINFDTAYTPRITIKFVDIRGNAIFQQGNHSKYSAFFDMPYPIFELKVKGFYGKPVTYCLHLYKWNSNFNSETGNFEINTEFIGYTYALLTDMLLGIIRAVIKTEKGKSFWKEETDKDPELMSIDEFMDSVENLAEEFDKIKNDDNNVKKLDESKETIDIINRLRERLTNLMKSMKGETGDYRIDTELGIVFSSKKKVKDNNKVLENLIKKEKEAIIKLLDDEKDGYNTKVSNEDLKIKSSDMTSFKDDGIGPITKNASKQSQDELAKTINNLNGSTAEGSVTRNSNEELAKEVKNYAPEVNEFYVFDLRNQFNKLNDKENKINEENKKLTEKLADELAAKAEENLNFKPTIRNITKMIITHSEVFLKTLGQVSKEAYEDDTRSNNIRDILQDKNNNINQKNTDKNKVYPWPEYYKSESSEGQQTSTESWIGKKVPQMQEVKFVEELLKILLKQTKEDIQEIDAQGQNNAANFYPISPIETQLTNLSSNDSAIKNNPYTIALKEDVGSRTVWEEAVTTLLLRGFLGLRVSNYSLFSSRMAEIMGEMEAENLFNAIVDFEDEKKRDIVDTIKGKNTIEDLISNFLGKKNEDINGKYVMNTVSFTDESFDDNESIKGDYYEYRYLIGNDGMAILPVNGGFNGKIFKNGNNLKSDGELAALKSEYLFIDNNINSTTNKSTTRSVGSDEYFKILDKDEYKNERTLPDFATTFFNEEKKSILSAFGGGSEAYIKQFTLREPTYNEIYPGPDAIIEDFKKYSEGTDLFTYNGRVKTLEISDIQYDSSGGGDSDRELDAKHFPKADSPEGVSSVLCAYWAQRNAGNTNNLGTYLCKGYDKLPSNLQFDYDKQDSEYEGILSNYVSDRTFIPNDYIKQRELLGFLTEEHKDYSLENKNKTYVPFIEFGVRATGKSIRYFSLFGSRFYYEQNTNEARAFLFLHSFGWQGLIGDIGDLNANIGDYIDVSLFDRYNEINKDESFYNEDDTPTLKGLFSNYGSFIKAPKLWCAFIGGIIYRYEEGSKGNDILRYSGNTQYPYFLPWQDDDSVLPKYYEYLYETSEERVAGMNFNIGADQYPDIDKTIINLPKEVKDKFKKVFQDFSNGAFINVRQEYELLYTEKPEDWQFSEWQTLHGNLLDIQYNQQKTRVKKIKVSELINIFDDKVYTQGYGIKNYVNITAQSDLAGGWTNDWSQKNAYQFTLVNRNGTEGANLIKNLIAEHVWILNGKPEIFRYNNYISTKKRYSKLWVNKDQFDVYLNGFLSRFKTLAKDYDKVLEKEQDKIEQQIFNTIDDDLIKLTIYRELSSVYNKWIAGNDSNLPVASCSANIKKEGLFNTFRFIDRSYNDIGDKFYINPYMVKELILGKPNKSVFSLLDTILRDNNFNFIPLPNFINYSDINDVVDVFKPYPFSKTKSISQGPSFVCMYSGQISNHLDMGEDSSHPDDSFIIDYDNNGYSYTKLPQDFLTQKDGNNSNIPYFLVSYGKQNQSYFKNLKLDQSEFTATLDSLNAVENLSNIGDKTKPTYNGQNLWNVYQNRAYTCEVDMMGNAMIQPFMYFQLSNVPMFRGTYNIFKVTHSITPHNMQTNFKGVRIKRTKTPLITKSELFSGLLGYLNQVETKKGRTGKVYDSNFTLQESSGGIII
jgi:hypothetical protein